MMTFRMAPPSCTASATAVMSSTRAPLSLARAAAMLITMSTSSAPSSTAPRASKALTSLGRGAQREADHGARQHAGALQGLLDRLDPDRVHADGLEPVLGGLGADLEDLGLAGLRLEQGVVDVGGDVAGAVRAWWRLRPVAAASLLMVVPSWLLRCPSCHNGTLPRRGPHRARPPGLRRRPRGAPPGRPGAAGRRRPTRRKRRPRAVPAGRRRTRRHPRWPRSPGRTCGSRGR